MTGPLHHPRFHLGTIVIAGGARGVLCAYPHSVRNRDRYGVRRADGSTDYYPADEIEPLPSEPKRCLIEVACQHCGAAYGVPPSRVSRTKYCSRQCQCTVQGGQPTIPEIADFMAEMAGTEGCWVWPYDPDKYGYGRCRHQGTRAKAHRAAYELAIGPIPPGYLVCHHCDNPPCCNPAHLFLGTHADNNGDMARKGRSPYGENNVRSKLTAEQAVAIRNDPRPSRRVAADFGISFTTVRDIKRGKLWRRA